MGLAPAAQAAPLISEVFYDAEGSDDGLSFIEIYGEPGSLLDGLRIEGVNGTNGAVAPVISLTGTIGADGLFVVADATAAGITFVPGADLLANFDLQNGPDSVVLRSDQEVLDALAYGEFAVGEVAVGEGLPALDAAAGASLARVWANVDTGDNFSDFTVLAAPTPGSAPLFVPEPSAASLGTAALVGLWWWGRRLR